MKRLVPSILVAGGILGRESTANAFTYPEHAFITARAVETRANRPNMYAMVRGLRERVVAHGAHVCDLEQFAKYPAPENCLTVFDLPALAGDHSASPEALVARWFGADDPSAAPLLRNAISGLSAFDLMGEPETSVAATLPKVQKFIVGVRAFQLRDLPLNVTGIDDAIAEADGDYAALAIRGRAHFRVFGMRAVDSAIHDGNTIAKYSHYHFRALVYAALATPDSQVADTWRGLALLNELFALHYIEDAVAAGHIVSPTFGVSVSTAQATHDAYNRDGIRVALPERLCAAATAETVSTGRFPKLAKACQARPLVGRLRGDYAMADGSVDKSPDDITLESSEVVVGQSLDEFLSAIGTAGSVDGSPNKFCAANVRNCLTDLSPRNTQISECEQAIRKNCKDVDAIEVADREAEWSAAAMLPEPIETEVHVRSFVAGSRFALSSGIFVFPKRSDSAATIAGSFEIGFSHFTPRRGANRFIFDVGIGAMLSEPMEQGTRALFVTGPFGRASASYCIQLSCFGIAAILAPYAHGSILEQDGRRRFGWDGLALAPAIDFGQWWYESDRVAVRILGRVGLNLALTGEASIGPFSELGLTVAF